MPAHRKASIRELAYAAYELDAGVIEGQLHRAPERRGLVDRPPPKAVDRVGAGEGARGSEARDLGRGRPLRRRLPQHLGHGAPPDLSPARVAQEYRQCYGK